MVLIICNKTGGICKVVHGLNDSYTFFRNQPLYVADKQDIKFFLDQVGEFTEFKVQEKEEAKEVMKKEAKTNVKKDSEYRFFLENINGIGEKTLLDILRVARTVEKLVTLLEADKLPLRDDVVKLLKKALKIKKKKTKGDKK